MNRKRAAWLAALLLWALLLAPFFFGALAAHPATDDFTFAAYTHPTWMETHSLPHVVKDALSYTLRTWRDWQGTATGVLVMALNPAVFSLERYGLHVPVLLALWLLADFVFIRRFFGRRLRLPRGVWLGAWLAVSAGQLLFLPDIVEGIYWFNGAWFYTVAQSAALILLALADVWSECAAPRGGIAARFALLALPLFALGMDNYITAMMTAAALAMMALQRAWTARRCAHCQGLIGVVRWTDGVADAQSRPFGGREAARAGRRAAVRTALLLLPLLAGLLLSVAAPGNAVRMAADGAHESGMGYALLSVGRTALAALGYIARFFTRTPLLGALLLATPPLLRALDAAPETGRLAPPVPATLAGFYLILCAMIVPHMYASGYAGSGRVVNMYHDYVLLAGTLMWVLILSRLRGRACTRLCEKRARRALTALGLAALAVCLLGGQIRNYVKLVRDQLDGTQAAYAAQFEREYALCEAAGAEDDVVLPAWTVQTMTGKPTAYTDPSVWTNESMARYFGVKSVRVGETQDGEVE